MAIDMFSCISTFKCCLRPPKPYRTRKGTWGKKKKGVCVCVCAGQPLPVRRVPRVRGHQISRFVKKPKNVIEFKNIHKLVMKRPTVVFNNCKT